MTYTIGIDIGSGAVKSVLFRHGPNGPEWLAKRCERIRRRDPMSLAEEGREGVLADAGVSPEAIDYIATTGWPSRSASFGAISRAIRSAPPPGG